ncbi:MULTISPECIES: phage tail assembly chaperone [unclassified Roseibium]|uniref:phage tail assembly chaperone n=1 Tax=unclassified Roseibium TaxID=2629323 RepID=UPI00273EAD1A|nr:MULTISPECIES: phage tail assembly chaperone [unclassified Roseibium]
MLPWADLLRITATRWAWTPAEFWAATPRELEAVLGLGHPADGLKRSELDQLIRTHPDTATCGRTEDHKEERPHDRS